MKNKYILIIATALAIATGCNKEPEKNTPKIAGSWELTDIQYTKAAQIGEYTIEVTLDFNADGTFSMSQILGDGRAAQYDGNWTLVDDILAGTYSDGKPWGASYKVSVDETTLSMTPVDKEAPETYIYARVK
ncbi:MAG: lipocalin family protein [Candidatus Cryptobacteroides sp.]